MNYLKYLNVIIIFLSVIFLSSCSNLDIQKLNYKALELMNSGNVDGAIARLESINDLDPKFPQTHYNLGIAYYKKGEYEKSINSLKQAISLNNGFSDAYYSLGVVYEEFATSEMDKSKNMEESQILPSMVEHLKLSRDAYKQYMRLAKDAPDAENIRLKIRELDNDINKYDARLNGIELQDVLPGFN